MKHRIITTILTTTSLWAIIADPGILQAEECTEITNAITWAKQSNPKITHPVTAYFTKHTGYITDPNSPKVGTGQDYCWYAVGQVQINLKPVEHLFGDLQLYMNSGNTSNLSNDIVKKPTSTVGVEIFPDGTFTYQQKLNGKSVGGAPPIKVTATCLGGALLTGTRPNEVITVGVRRDPQRLVPPPLCPEDCKSDRDDCLKDVNKPGYPSEKECIQMYKACLAHPQCH